MSAEETVPGGKRVIKLKHPVTFDDEVIRELTVRRGKAGDMKGIILRDDEVAANDLMIVASRLCGVEPKVIAELDVEDAGEVMNAALDFFALYLKGGNGASR